LTTIISDGQAALQEIRRRQGHHFDDSEHGATLNGPGWTILGGYIYWGAQRRLCAIMPFNHLFLAWSHAGHITSWFGTAGSISSTW
jgi:hypothetical protein